MAAKVAAPIGIGKAAPEGSAVTTINCDMGEALGLSRMGDDEALKPRF
jgi:hypothetical protein